MFKVMLSEHIALYKINHPEYRQYSFQMKVDNTIMTMFTSKL